MKAVLIFTTITIILLSTIIPITVAVNTERLKQIVEDLTKAGNTIILRELEKHVGIPLVDIINKINPRGFTSDYYKCWHTLKAAGFPKGSPDTPGATAKFVCSWLRAPNEKIAY